MRGRTRPFESFEGPMVKRFAGMAPFLGALISIALVLAAGVSERGLGAVGDWLLDSVTHPVALLALIQAAYTAMQSLLWLRYRPFVAPANAVWPKVSVIIPAFNEGPMVERSIRSVAAADYPRELLEIIVVDDGSRDDTLFHMQHLRREFPSLVRLMRFPGNEGKRAALEAGFRSASGEVFVTIDSDSEIDPSTVREMVAPFLVDDMIGAVAGRVAVLNRDSMISRMLEVQYALAFDFARAAQSVYRSVACCPGALSSFRARLILPHLDEWTHQTFLGRPVGHGEDQALTNIVLRQGYDTVYQSTATVNTLAPTKYWPMTRMFLRWERSYIVEGFSFAKFMFTRYRKKNRVLPIVAFFASNLRLVFAAWGIVQLPSALDRHLGTMGWALASMAVGALFSAAYYLRIEKSFRFMYGLAYALFSFFLLQWILPWALVTVRDERWGTR